MLHENIPTKLLADQVMYSCLLLEMIEQGRIAVDLTKLVFDYVNTISSRYHAMRMPPIIFDCFHALIDEREQISYSDQMVREEIVNEESQRFCANYEMPVLRTSTDLYGWIALVTQVMYVAQARTNFTPELWRSIIAQVVINSLKPDDLGLGEIDQIARGIRQRCDGDMNKDLETLTITLWQDVIVPYLQTTVLENFQAYAQTHQQLKLIHGEKESAISFLERALVRIAAIEFTDSLVPKGKARLSQILQGLRPDVRTWVERVLVQYQIGDLETLKAKFHELKTTVFSRLSVLTEGRCERGPNSAEEL